MVFSTEKRGFETPSTGELTPIVKIPVQIGAVEVEYHTGP